MTDNRLEQIVGNLLRTGVVLAAIQVLAGGVWWLAVSGGAPVDYHQFRAGARGLHWLGTLTGPQRLILLGLLILIATPIARVAFSLAAFAIERDWAYVGITLGVLAVLLYSIGAAWW